jgi:glyoxylase-like metal-dependent hydrolase (beta-lactamase superfamily II)/rhodanese-related sulfurtransferase
MTALTIDVETLRLWLTQERPVTVLDIRKAQDRAEWAIPGSLHIDAYDALKANDPNALVEADLPADQPVVTICGVGKVSMVAADQLRARGLEAFSLAGGIKAWSLAWNVAELVLPGTDVRIVQVRRTGKGCLSYLIGAKGEAAVIDAALEPEVYLKLARDHEWAIRHVLDTHVHADHLSRTRQLAAQSGATLSLPAQDRVTYPFTPLREGDGVWVWDAPLVALHTPGHTQESTCYLLDSKALFTGDTLFLAGVGRPDLEASPDEARQRAQALYHSLRRLLLLPPQTMVLPGHTSQPVAFDGEVLAAPLGSIRASVTLLHEPEGSFVEAILGRIPPTPPNHQQIVHLNETGEAFAGDPTELEAGANRCAVM